MRALGGIVIVADGASFEFCHWLVPPNVPGVIGVKIKHEQGFVAQKGIPRIEFENSLKNVQVVVEVYTHFLSPHLTHYSSNANANYI